jgi:hypothetical protein
MKDNTQIAHTKFQKYTTSPTGVIAKRQQKRQKVFFWPLSILYFSHSKALRVSENPRKNEFMFFLCLKETRHFYIKKLFSYQFICSKSTLWG